MDAAGTGPGWLHALPAGRAFLAWIIGLVAIAVVLRGMAARKPAGRRVLDALHAAEAYVIALLLLAMLVLSFLQIVLRNVAETGLLWIDPLLRHLLLWIGFAGASLAARLDRHMNIEALSRILPGRLHRSARFLTLLATSAVCLLLAGACLEAVREEASAGTTSFLGLPTWLVQSIMPLGFTFMTYRFARRSFAHEAGREAAQAAARAAAAGEEAPS